MSGGVVERYQARTAALARKAVAGVLAVFAAVQWSRVSDDERDEAEAAMAGTIAFANAAATTLAAAFVAASVESATGRPHPPSGVAPRDDLGRLTRAVRTILGDLGPTAESAAVGPTDMRRSRPVGPVGPSSRDTGSAVGPTGGPTGEPDPAEVAAMRLERLAKSEPLDTAATTTEQIVAEVPEVVGWTRRTDPDACERCRRWAEGGRVFPADHPFKRHHGCNCAPEIVVSTNNNGRNNAS